MPIHGTGVNFSFLFFLCACMCALNMIGISLALLGLPMMSHFIIFRYDFHQKINYMLTTCEHYKCLMIIARLDI